jgi:hypothetical protein
MWREVSGMAEQETIPVPRNRVFVLVDGTFVVQWEENRVQDLLSGRYRPFSEETLGNPISDYELGQLKNRGIVAHFDHELIHLSPNPNLLALPTTRAYYLNTALPKTDKGRVENRLQTLDLLTRFSVRATEKFVVIRGPNGVAFNGFEETEKARELLIASAPDVFADTIVAFVEKISAS